MTDDATDQKGAASQKTFDIMEVVRLLDPATLEIEQTLADGLKLRCPECGEVSGVTVRPCFPVTQRERFLAFKDADGQEIGILEDMAQLPERFQQALGDELDKQHFIPVITQVDAIFQEFHIPIWQVQTDRGPRRLELRSRHDAHRMADGRIYVRDAEGNPYIIPDYRQLSLRSQQLIELYV